MNPNEKNTEFVVSSKGPPRLPEPPFGAFLPDPLRLSHPWWNSQQGELYPYLEAISTKKTKGHNMTQLQTQQRENMHHSEQAKVTEWKPLSVLSG